MSGTSFRMTGGTEMEVFGALGKRADEARAKAMQRARDVSETTRLNGKIADEQKRVTDAYTRIGKLYVSLHETDGEDAFAEMRADIRDAEEKMKNYRRQLMGIRGVKQCENCGAESPKDAMYCSFCGTELPMYVEVVFEKPGFRCSGCGTELLPEMNFCTACGKPVGEGGIPKNI